MYFIPETIAHAYILWIFHTDIEHIEKVIRLVSSIKDRQIANDERHEIKQTMKTHGIVCGSTCVY